MITKLLYNLNQRAPVLFASVRLASGVLARRIHAIAIREAIAGAELSARVDGSTRVTHPIHAGDVDALATFLVFGGRPRWSSFTIRI